MCVLQMLLEDVNTVVARANEHIAHNGRRRQDLNALGQILLHRFRHGEAHRTTLIPRLARCNHRAIYNHRAGHEPRLLTLHVALQQLGVRADNDSGPQELHAGIEDQAPGVFLTLQLRILVELVHDPNLLLQRSLLGEGIGDISIPNGRFVNGSIGYKVSRCRRVILQRFLLLHICVLQSCLL